MANGQEHSHQAVFVMEHFRVSAPGQLEIEGSWRGVPHIDLDRSALVLHAGERVDRVDATRISRNARTWNAVFLWNGEPDAIERTFLELGDRLVVEFPAGPSSRRRLGRTVRPALPLVSEDASGGLDENDVVSLQAALLAAELRLANAEEETALAQAETRRASEEATRERARRNSETTRLSQALKKLERVAEDELRKERERQGVQASEIERLEQELTGARQELVAARRDVAAVLQERDEHEASIRAEIESAREQLAAERLKNEELEARQGELRVALSDARSEVEELRLAAANATARVERLKEELAEARRRGADAKAEATRLSDWLKAVQAVLEEG
jgi:hypothetical protein